MDAQSPPSITRGYYRRGNGSVSVRGLNAAQVAKPPRRQRHSLPTSARLQNRAAVISEDRRSSGTRSRSVGRATGSGGPDGRSNMPGLRDMTEQRPTMPSLDEDQPPRSQRNGNKTWIELFGPPPSREIIVAITPAGRPCISSSPAVGVIDFGILWRAGGGKGWVGVALPRCLLARPRRPGLNPHEARRPLPGDTYAGARYLLRHRTHVSLPSPG
jgi:hypothetical protein